MSKETEWQMAFELTISLLFREFRQEFIVNDGRHDIYEATNCK